MIALDFFMGFLGRGFSAGSENTVISGQKGRPDGASASIPIPHPLQCPRNRLRSRIFRLRFIENRLRFLDFRWRMFEFRLPDLNIRLRIINFR